jgi:hypothetical protein
MSWLGQMACRIKKCGQSVLGWHEERSHLEDLDINMKIFLNWAVKKYDLMTWTGLIWLRAGTSTGPLWIRTWPCALYKMRGISWLAEGLVASRGLCCILSVSRAEINEGNESLNCRLQPCALIINLVLTSCVHIKLEDNFFHRTSLISSQFTSKCGKTRRKCRPSCPLCEHIGPVHCSLNCSWWSWTVTGRKTTEANFFPQWIWETNIKIATSLLKDASHIWCL